MYNTTLKTLVEKLATINKLEEVINKDYSSILNSIEIAEDYGVDFRHTLEMDDEDFYINVKKIDEKTKRIKNYAVGINSRSKKINQLRHDDEDHHNDKKQVKEVNPPHHKHLGKDEIVKGFSGNVNDMIQNFKNILD